MKHILITGGNSGIGEALALHYAKDGVCLSLCARNKERLNDVAQKCQAKGADVHITAIDVTDKSAMNEWVRSRDKEMPLSMVIANAGVGLTDANVDTEQGMNQSEKTLHINMDGVVNTIHPVIPNMVGRKNGQIVLISSLAGYRGFPETAAYSASKAFVKVYGEGLRGTLAKHNVQVNVVCPGFVRSRLTDQNTCPMPFFMEADKAAAVIAKGIANNKGRIAFPWPMALSVWFLSALPDCVAEWVTRKFPPKVKDC